MKLILTHEVSNLGGPGEIVEVKDGYGRNFLLPRGFAIRWTRGGQKQVDSITGARESRQIHDVEQAQSLKGQLEKAPINVPVQAGQGGRLFGAVTVNHIAEALKDAGAEVDKRRIETGNVIKTLGAHTVTVRVHADVTAEVQLNVVAAK